VCGNDLLSTKYNGIVVIWENAETDLDSADEMVDVHLSCKGQCDQALEARIKRKYGFKVMDGWEDLSDLQIPLVYLSRLMAILNGLHRGDRWSPEAFDKLKRMLIAVYPHVARDASSEEIERTKRLMQIPEYLGGLGIA
jgi:hypothetical protein